MRKVTLCFLLKDNEILLAAKKRSLSGFNVAVGKWNGVGGKIEGEFHFNEDGTEFTDFSVREI